MRLESNPSESQQNMKELPDSVGDAPLFNPFIKEGMIGINSGPVCLCKLQHLVQGIWTEGLESVQLMHDVCLYNWNASTSGTPTKQVVQPRECFFIPQD